MGVRAAVRLEAATGHRLHVVASDLPGTNGMDETSGSELASATAIVVEAEFPADVLYFGDIWISPAGDLVALPSQQVKRSS